MGIGVLEEDCAVLDSLDVVANVLDQGVRDSHPAGLDTEQE